MQEVQNKQEQEGRTTDVDEELKFVEEKSTDHFSTGPTEKV